MQQEFFPTEPSPSPHHKLLTTISCTLPPQRALSPRELRKSTRNCTPEGNYLHGTPQSQGGAGQQQQQQQQLGP